MRRYARLPLFAKILLGALLGVPLGFALGPRADSLKPVSDLVLQLLTLLATPLVFLSVFHALLSTELRGRLAGRLAGIFVTNSFAAAAIGLVVANVLVPGRHIAYLGRREVVEGGLPSASNTFQELLSRIPRDLITPFQNNDMLGIAILAVAFALAFKIQKTAAPSISANAEIAKTAVIKLLHWLFELIPLAVLAVVARIVGTVGLAPFGGLAWFVGVVVLGLALTVGYYAIRLILAKRSPVAFVRGGSDALLLAFSTASSAATLPVSYQCAVGKLAVPEETASLGVLAGGAFNHDGGALYQAMCALAVSQMIGQPLGAAGQAELLVIAVVGSICTAGIPQAGLITMVAVFQTLRLPTEWIPFLLPVDWFLDRCRTAVNVAGNLVGTWVVAAKPGG